jgi:hypothetical protein
VPAIDENAFNDIRHSLGDVPDNFIVPELSVFNALKRLKVTEAVNDEFLSNRIVKEFADVLAAPVCSLINSSIRQGVVPSQWKTARITPIPKVHPPVSVETDLRPISITSSIAKVAETFICQFFNEHFNSLIDENQYGCTFNRSTTHALIKLSDLFYKCSDSSGNFIRILFVDFSKAFDLVDHNILMRKFLENNFPLHIVAWSLSFLQDRTQYVKIGDVESFCGRAHAGAPQGTRCGPDVFKLLTNDLRFCQPYAKYVDDTTVVSISDDPADNSLQSATNDLLKWCNDNGMLINVNKTKEMVIHFGKLLNKADVPLLTINNVQIERVETFKLLGVVFSSDLSWRHHVLCMLNKISKRYFIIYQLVKIGMALNDILAIYCSVIRSVLEYACPVWHCGLTQAQSDDIEGVQKRCLKIILPQLSYRDSLAVCNLERLDTRREQMVHDLFIEIKEPGHVLHNLLPYRRFTAVATRDHYSYELPLTKTFRYSRSFIPHCIRKRY